MSPRPHHPPHTQVFDETVSTAEVYRHTAQPLVGSIFRGANATCFAYGQTGEADGTGGVRRSGAMRGGWGHPAPPPRQS